MRRLVGVALFDLLLLLLAFFIVHLFKYKTLVIGERHDDYVLLVLLSWLVFSAVFKKFSSLDRFSLTEGISAIALTGFMMVGATSLFIVMLGLIDMSRILVYGTIFLFAGMEIAAFVFYYLFYGKTEIRPKRLPGSPPRSWFNPSLILVAADAFLLMAAIILATYIKHTKIEYSSNNFDIFFMFFGLWLPTSIVLRKFEKINFHSVYGLLGITIKSTLTMTAGLAFIIFGLQYYYLSRSQIFGALLIFAVFELILFYLYYRYRSYMREEQESEYPSVVAPRAKAMQCRLGPADAEEGPCKDPVDEKIRHALHFLEPDLYGFIDQTVDLAAIDTSQSAMMHTDKLFNIGIMENCQNKLIINLHKINDIRFLNQYFLLAHDKLKTHGYLVGKAHTLDTHRAYFMNQFPGQSHLARVLYILDFIWNRMFPKLPGIKKIYFALTKGKSRLLSRAEILGRLYFCGFVPIAENTISDRFYFIAQKLRMPSIDANPTYGPLVELTRFGMRDKPITVYKFRTMHPYSEYVQEYVYEKNQLEKGGKFKNDFRVTGWGVLMRKFWIDELPMLYNWLRGDLQLVGVRPLSGQYLELYTPELQALRRQVKPGLLPPFYADMPVTIEEIMASEQRYIEAYLKQPMKTQMVYFFRCVYNIVFKKARSG